MPLTDVKCRQAKSRATRYKLHDSDGLYLDVMPTGNRYWRMRYRIGNRRPSITFGEYPHVGLRQARTHRDEAHRLLAGGTDPLVHKRTTTEAAAQTFAHVAERWLSRQTGKADTRQDKRARLDLHVLPIIGTRPVGAITTPEVLAMLRRLESAGKLETARKVGQVVAQVFAFGIAEGLVLANPASGLTRVLASPVTAHRPAITEPVAFGELLRAIDGYAGTLPVRTALRFQALVPLRPKEMRLLEWAFYDPDAALFTIPGEVMKGVDGKTPDNLLPVPRQAVRLLDEIRPLTGHGRFVFPNPRTAPGSPHERPLSENGVASALHRLGYKGVHCGHGFRSSFSTLAGEVLGEERDTIERVLAHLVGSEVERAYSRGKHVERKRAVLQRWADYVDGLRTGATVIPMRRGAVAR